MQLTVRLVACFVLCSFTLFRKFADAKRNFSTEAEEKGWSFVFVGHLDSVQSKSFNKENLDQKFVWMIPVLGTTWKMPTGPGSSIDDKLDHPVVHVSQRDASAYCRWAKKRLPSEYEWEYAARGGLKGTEYPWGDEYQIGRTNLWQGPFPDKDTGNDGFAGTSPVDAFPSQNNYELFDMVGNVWEWTNTKYHIRFHNMIGRDNYFTVRGGSYLDSRRGHVNLRARVSARDGKMFDYSAGNVGFRCASSENVKTGPSIVLTKSSFVIHSEL